MGTRMKQQCRSGTDDARDEGFTLVELLVVFVIMAILATLAVQVFLNQRQKGWDTAAKSDLRNAANVQETIESDINTYGDVTQLLSWGFSTSPDVTLTVVSVTSSAYCMSAQSKSGEMFYISTTSGGVTSTPIC